MTDPALIGLIAEVMAKLDTLEAEITELARGREGWLNADQAATYIGAAGRERIYDLARQGDIPVHRDGRRLLFRPSEIDNYIEGSRFE
jgi:excisionase family DNA binding protein